MKDLYQSAVYNFFQIYKSIHEWIESQQLRSDLCIDDRVKLLGIGSEFDRQTVGISCTFFTVTYSFISSVSFVFNMQSPRNYYMEQLQ